MDPLSYTKHGLGSSPLARGALLGAPPGDAAGGLIPARAGSTRGRFGRYAVDWAHPRSRGAHVGPGTNSEPGNGSSPLARGAPVPTGARRGHPGLIPARAGSTLIAHPHREPRRTHPRSRGEHSAAAWDSSSTTGSSPLARGARRVRTVHDGLRGLIPARAGSTPPRPRRSSGSGAHPRSRGEHATVAGATIGLLGSSPLARGALVGEVATEGTGGLIPARAGSTPVHTRRHWQGWAHPRSRGEHIPVLRSLLPAQGSSPLVRGAPRTSRARASRSRAHPRSRGEHAGGVALFLAGPRLIPARAGSTRGLGRGRGPPQAHPRSRGEHPVPTRPGGSRSGSSPLARGARWVRDGAPVLARLIPARAGSTEQTTRAHAGEGSSPLARGALGVQGVQGGRVGLIPARAGSTGRSVPGWRTPRAHPRSRGEHMVRLVRTGAPVGSSPLARGARPVASAGWG